MSPLPLPGHQAPAAGFEAPFDLLSACHERVQRSLDLLDRLVAHVAEQGADAAARSAARDVLRYFDLAAPHHHEDEERHVFPRLLAGGDAALAAAVRQLQADHVQMAGRWQALRPLLVALEAGERPGEPALRAASTAFAGLYAAHIALEDGTVFPAALARTDAAARAAMGEEMATRRGATRPPPATPRG